MFNRRNTFGLLLICFLFSQILADYGLTTYSEGRDDKRDEVELMVEEIEANPRRSGLFIITECYGVECGKKLTPSIAGRSQKVFVALEIENWRNLESLPVIPSKAGTGAYKITSNTAQGRVVVGYQIVTAYWVDNFIPRMDKWLKSFVKPMKVIKVLDCRCYDS